MAILILLFLDACYVDACFVFFLESCHLVFFEAPKCPNLDIVGDTAGFATHSPPGIRQTNDAQWLRRCTTKMIDDDVCVMTKPPKKKSCKYFKN